MKAGALVTKRVENSPSRGREEIINSRDKKGEGVARYFVYVLRQSTVFAA